MQFLVCDKWTLTIQDGLLDIQQPAKGMRKSYLQFVDDNIGDVADQAWCYEYLMSNIPKEDVASMASYMSGIGMNATIMRNLHPFCRSFVFNDLDKACVAHLGTLDFPRVELHNYDAWDAMVQHPHDFNADLVTLDINSFTVHQLLTKKPILEALKFLFGQDPAYVVIADSACSRLHLNKDTYSTDTGHDIETVDDYLCAMSDVLGVEYGYNVWLTAYHHAAAYMLIVPGTDILTEDAVKAPPEARRMYFRRIDNE